MVVASMATASASPTEAATDDLPATGVEEAAVRAVHKRYEALTMVRSKAIKGKGAWYWAHLQPVLVQSADGGLPKAVKLRCALCDTIFSASNPSRTASEHLKRGTCPNFASPSSSAAGAFSSALPPPPKPISSIPPSSSNSRKRSSPSVAINPPPVPRLALVDPSRFSSPPTTPVAGEVVYSTPPPLLLPPPPPPQPLLSGGKDDLGPLAMLENRVKKLKSSKASPGHSLTKAQADSALSFLSDWFHESGGTGAVSLSSVEHPKFRAFLAQVGLPPVSCRDLVGRRLDARYEDARVDAEARIHDALFFQLASDGWNKYRDSTSCGDAIVNLTINLPNGTAVFHRSVLTHGRTPSKSAEEVLLDTVADIAGEGAMHRCAGIIADKFKATALLNLENRHPWMVNLSCQLQGFRGLVKDLSRELPLLPTVAAKCYKLATFFNGHSQVRSIFRKYQLQQLDYACLLRVPPSFDAADGGRIDSSVFAMMEDILNSARAVQSVILDESYKKVCHDDPVARELADMILEMSFWNELEAAHTLVKLVEGMAQEMEAERPLVGQCLPLWEELRSKLKDWCSKYGIKVGTLDKVMDKRFKKNYHPAWSAAFILDPVYLVKDVSGKYLPPFKCLNSDQEKDVDRLITRLVCREEAHIALMELMKWRTEGLDPLYAQAVQVKQLDPVTGKLRIANPQSSRLVWETCLSEFKSLGKVAVRLIFLHATSHSFKHNPSPLRQWLGSNGRSRTSVDRVHKLIFVAAQAKLERRDFSNEEDKDSALFTSGEDDDDLDEAAFAEASPLTGQARS